MTNEKAISLNAVKDLFCRICMESNLCYRSKETCEDLKLFDKLPPVTPQSNMGCEGCAYEKTGNNSTYPCSHCGRCYTDKYKAESEDKE